MGNVTNMRNIFSNSGLSTENYDNILIGWAGQEVQTGVRLDASGITYCAGAAVQEQLITNHGWTINDWSQSCTARRGAAIMIEDGPGQEDIAWDVYPNPVSDLLAVQKEKEVKVYLTDLGGRPVVSEKVGSYFELDLSGLKPGVYLLMVREVRS